MCIRDRIRGFVQLKRGFVWETRKGTWGAIRKHDDHGHHSDDPNKYRKHGGSYFKDKAHAIQYVNGSDHDKLTALREDRYVRAMEAKTPYESKFEAYKIIDATSQEIKDKYRHLPMRR